MGTHRRICVCVNGPYEKTNGVRARELFREVERAADVRYLYRDDARRLASAVRFCREIVAMRPDVVFVVETGYAGVCAAALARLLFGSRVILNTGDAAYALARTSMGFWKAQLVRIVEWLGHRVADVIAVCGPYHQDLLTKQGFRRVVWLPNGVDTARFRPDDASALRQRLGAGDHLTIGVVGSINWNSRLQVSYGSEVLEVIRRLEDLPVRGVIVGPGSGVPILQQKATAYGIQDRVIFTGWVDHDALPEYMNAIDICISTQSDDVVGHVRITAKVPEYLACGRFIIATDVGGARQFVEDAGVLLPLDGLTDARYYDRIAAVVREIVADRSRLQRGRNGVEVARRYFDYGVLRQSLHQVLESIA